MPFSSLKDFEAVEVLNSDPTRKAIFILLKHKSEGRPAVLIADKHPFTEDLEAIKEWVQETQLNVVMENAIYSDYTITAWPDKFAEAKSTLIYPATDKHIMKYRRRDLHLIYETPHDYENISKPTIEESQFNLDWVYNFLDKKAESDRIVFEDPDPNYGFLLAPDIKWNGKNVEDLYLLAVVNRRDIKSVRDLTGEHIPLLENIREQCYRVVAEKYKLKSSQVSLYFHYQPSFYHLHIHVTNIKYDAPGKGPTNVLLEHAISSLKLMSDYFQRQVLAFHAKEGDALLTKFREAGRLNE